MVCRISTMEVQVQEEQVMRRLIALLSLILLSLILSTATGGVIPGKALAQSSQTAVKGFDPYTLGAPMNQVIRADPSLSNGSWPAWTDALPTVQYGKEFQAPIGGYQYRARLGLQFWQGQLAVVIIAWPNPSFDSVEDWRTASRALHDQLARTYAPEIVTRNNLFDNGLMTFEVTDAEGNQLKAWASYDHFNMTLAYLLASFARAVTTAPKPSITY